MIEDETIQLTFRRFRTGQGKPTCSAYVGTRECEFCQPAKFGLMRKCWWLGNQTLHHYDTSDLTGEGGYLRPLPGCPIWKDEEENNEQNG